MFRDILLDIPKRLLGPPQAPDCPLSRSVDRAYRPGFYFCYLATVKSFCTPASCLSLRFPSLISCPNLWIIVCTAYSPMGKLCQIFRYVPWNQIYVNAHIIPNRNGFHFLHGIHPPFFKKLNTRPLSHVHISMPPPSHGPLLGLTASPKPCCSGSSHRRGTDTVEW